jgi:hypothetical protein
VKTCSACRTPKDEGEFYKDKRRTDGLYPQCRKCASSSKKKSRSGRTQEQIDNDRAVIKHWRKQNPEKDAEHDRRAKFKKEFGITLERYEELLEEQCGVCAICGNGCTSGRRLAVDHAHDDTKQVRGLLCHRCNRGLGFFKDDLDLLEKAIRCLCQYRLD